MKFKVTYYDYDSDSSITENCYNFSYDSKHANLDFIPVDDPIKSYKAVVIDHPIVSVHQNDRGIKIFIEGYQYTKNGGYWKTKTIIESVKEN